jgi:hypothetical protein
MNAKIGIASVFADDDNRRCPGAIIMFPEA